MPTLLLLWLAIAPPKQSYQQSASQLTAALEAINTIEPKDANLAESTQSLERALERFTQYPDDLVADADTRAQLLEARLSLVWLYLSAGDGHAAVVAMDEAIRSAPDHSLPAIDFGPAVLGLYKDRLRALAVQGTGRLDVDCGQRACVVLINEHRAPNPSEPLYLGNYRVWVGAREPGAAWAFFAVTIDEPGQTARPVYHPQIDPTLAETILIDVKPPAPKRNNAPPAPSPQRPQHDPRILPRWASILGLTLGAGLAVAGGVLRLDAACPGAPNPMGTSGCAQIPAAASYAMIGAGAGGAALFGVLLTIDEVRGANTKGHQATLGWGFRF